MRIRSTNSVKADTERLARASRQAQLELSEKVRPKPWRGLFEPRRTDEQRLVEHISINTEFGF